VAQELLGDHVGGDGAECHPCSRKQGRLAPAETHAGAVAQESTGSGERAAGTHGFSLGGKPRAFGTVPLCVVRVPG
jgi:hypothetical protein